MPDSPIDQLPTQLAMLTIAVASAANSLKLASRERWFMPPGRAFWFQVPSATMTWRLSISRRGSETFFFFFTRDNPAYVPLDAVIQMTLRLGMPGTTSGSVPQALPVSVRYPSFFVVDLDDADFARFTPPGASRQDTVVLAIGDRADLFAIRFGKKRQVIFSSGKVPGSVQTGPYALAPLLNLIDTIAEWSEDGSPAGPEVAVIGGNQTSMLHQVLSKVGEGYLSARGTLDQFRGVSLPNLDPDSYELTAYEAAIELKLKKDGSLSAKPNDERFRLQLRMKIRDLGQPSSDVVLSPSGLFISGPLYDSFLDNIADFGTSAYVANLLDGLIVETSFEERRLRAQQFAKSSRDNARILLAGTGINDPLYLLLMRGSLYDTPTTLLFVAEFKTESHTAVSWNLEGEMERLAGFTGEPANITIERSNADYIFPIIENIKRWGEFL